MYVLMNRIRLEKLLNEPVDGQHAREGDKTPDKFHSQRIASLFGLHQGVRDGRAIICE